MKLKQNLRIIIGITLALFVLTMFIANVLLTLFQKFILKFMTGTFGQLGVNRIGLIEDSHEEIVEKRFTQYDNG